MNFYNHVEIKKFNCHHKFQWLFSGFEGSNQDYQKHPELNLWQCNRPPLRNNMLVCICAGCLKPSLHLPTCYGFKGLKGFKFKQYFSWIRLCVELCPYYQWWHHIHGLVSWWMIFIFHFSPPISFYLTLNLPSVLTPSHWLPSCVFRFFVLANLLKCARYIFALNCVSSVNEALLYLCFSRIYRFLSMSVITMWFTLCTNILFVVSFNSSKTKVVFRVCLDIGHFKWSTLWLLIIIIIEESYYSYQFIGSNLH